ncbi:hypothetical protein [Arthrobacter sp. B1805]|uniref:hypothetical protein n=1 Tax=Arthrobacter sp. B1805 TaxID=2058892 RepID=UPI000CE2BAC8|nr:hypothetical protein [Arthrobacter sp. B1805]
MKLIISGKKYELDESMQKASLNDLYVLKVRSGMGIKSLKDNLIKMQTYEDPLDFLDEADNLMALQAMIWLCRRFAGENLTIEQANSCPLNEIGFESDEPEPEAEAAPDPKVTPPDSDPAGEPPAPQ